MAFTPEPLTIEQLERRFRDADDVVERNHFQTILLLSKGRSRAEVAEILSFSERWVLKIEKRYAIDGPDGLGDRRRNSRGGKPLLSPDDLSALRERLNAPPDDGGVWTGPKVARWMAVRLGVESVHAPRGWEALKRLGFSLKAPRPKNPHSATPEAVEAFKKSSPTSSHKRRGLAP
ncbi:Transposase [Fulvimarina manganoxydans]|uniref:Transposase n=1 Tax=Fulvimarina manganoxydans TaxID=937218 RepID=A0A1W2F033_9HYPH|nr:winged helix-turn-helix domain-containing protein [Fulvimarina manganoxydans]SMD15192.1 Transposase [Fulvimarina manganoxydans]